jgi:hypothetical protein
MRKNNLNRRILAIGIACIAIAAIVIMFYPKPRPDLSVSRMVVEPSNVEIGQYFEAEAWIRNYGKGKSGNFRVKTYFRSPFYDDYTLGDISIDGLSSGEEKQVFSRDDLRLWDEGFHQIIVEVKPLDFTDKDNTNNDKEYQITVVAPDLPDLAIVSILVFPQQPQAGKMFYAEVNVKNIGNIASGDYDIAIHIKDISRGYVYPIGTFRRGPIQPGQQYVVWMSDMVRVNDPGSFQLWAEINPFQFDDEDDDNNIKYLSFTVNP